MAKPVIVRLDWYGDELEKAVEKAGDPALFEMGQILLKDAKGRITRRSGKTRKSGYVATKSKSTYRKRPWQRKEVRTSSGAVVAFAAIHAHILERTGAQPHTIKPHNKKALSIPGIGMRSRVKMHPGTKAKPFLKPALDSTKNEMILRFVHEVGKDIEAKK